MCYWKQTLTRTVECIIRRNGVQFLEQRCCLLKNTWIFKNGSFNAKYNNNTLTLLHSYNPTHSNIYMVTLLRNNIEGWQDFIQ